ncbi:MAG: NADH-ubiquinone oxidoreductase subunit E family protein [Campylobacteraceae bacterium]|jgi:NADH-quinone oxidoreductase subunit E|nr:NADH-ubiquinone oxidoreductase subunit E family protein [Campylobacteraceae bacterium]
MRRYDLRGCENNLKIRLLEILNEGTKNEVLIFIFESVSDEQLRDIINAIREKNGEVLNSLRFNEVDWTIVVRAKGFYE